MTMSRLPKQPEINIGTLGHVDHGKCVSLDEFILVNGRITTAENLVKTAEFNGRIVKECLNERLIRVPSLQVESLTSNGRLVKASALLYVQPYKGSIVGVETVEGRSIRVTPNHPLLTLVGNGVRWVKAEELRAGCKIAAVSRLDGAGKLVFDEVRKVTLKPYDDIVVDLVVPQHRNFVAGDGGIIAHNTTLVQAITGVWAARHSEELKRGITIKLGYADTGIYKCPKCPPPQCYSTKPVCPVCGSETEFLRAVSFVDAPGHEILMTTTLSGANVMDGAILVIAADEPCPQPQTREHLAAAEIVGVKNRVVCQNKLVIVSREKPVENYERMLYFS